MKKETTSQRLKQIMADKGLKQVDILKKCEPYCKKYGVKLGSNGLSQYVTGKVEPSQRVLTVLAKALNTNEVWLMGFDVPMEPAKKENLEINDIMFKTTIIEVLRSKKISIPPTEAIANIEPQKWTDFLEGTQKFTFEEKQKICNYFNINDYSKINDGSLYEELINKNNGSYFSELLRKQFNESEINDMNNKSEIYSIIPNSINIIPDNFTSLYDFRHQISIVEDILYSILIEEKLVIPGKRINSSELEKIEVYFNNNIEYINDKIEKKKKQYK